MGLKKPMRLHSEEPPAIYQLENVRNVLTTAVLHGRTPNKDELVEIEEIYDIIKANLKTWQREVSEK